MNYYDEEIEINREASKETAHISQPADISHLDNFMNVSHEIEEASTSKTKVSESNNSIDDSKTNSIHNRNDQNKNSKDNTESSASETDEDATQNDDPQKKYDILTSDKWKNLSVPQDIKDIIQNILKYAPQTIDTEYKLLPFIPEFVPSVGDVDAFLKVFSPEALDKSRTKEIQDFMKEMGLSILDEPSGKQSDPNLLNMKLRSVFNNPGSNNSTKRTPTARNSRDIDKWINEIDEIHRDQSVYHINTIELNDEINIDDLMAEWPKQIEENLNKNGFPMPESDKSLQSYLNTVMKIFQIPIGEHNFSNYVKALNIYFNLYLAINETFNFK